MLSNKMIWLVVVVSMCCSFSSASEKISPTKCSEASGVNSTQSSSTPFESGCSKSHGFKTIKRWWQDMGVQEPVKCPIPSGWYKQDATPMNHFSFGKAPVISFPCRSGEDRFDFSFSGQIRDGQLAGLGHLQLDVTNSPTSTGSCLHVNRISGREIVDVVGTFVNGTLQGNCKINLEDGSLIIGSFHNGLADGLSREWDDQGRLTFAGFYQSGRHIGRCWRRVGESLIYEDCSTLDRSNEKSIIIPLSNSLSVLAGNFYPHIDSIDEIQLAKLTSVRMEDKSCFLRVEAELGEQMEFFYDLLDDQAIPKTAHKDQPLCLLDKKPAPEQLLNWFSDLNELMTQKIGHQILMLLNPETSNVDEDLDAKYRVIDDIVLEPETKMSAKFFGVVHSDFEVTKASFDSAGRLHGPAEFLLPPPSHPPRFGFSFEEIFRLSANFKHGQLSDGIIILDLQDFRRVYLTVQHGVPHGPAIIAGIAPILPNRLERPPQEVVMTEEMNQLGFIGRFVDGNPSGKFWLKMIGGGFMHGSFKDGQATGEDMAFIYPDMETAFHGNFKDFVMVQASEVDVKAVACNDADGLLVVSNFEKLSDPIYYYEPPTNVSFGAGPEGVIDPYERKWVDVADSSVPNSGQGVFAKHDVPAFRCISLYSGLTFNAGEQSLLRAKNCDYNRDRSMDERRSCSKYTLAMTWFKTAISIPPEMDKPEIFHPALGPKVNHHFLRNNSAYTDFEHPRWGSIMCVQSRIPIEAGDEIFTFYGYQEGSFPNDFPWYFDELQRIESDERLSLEMELNRRSRSNKIKVVGASHSNLFLTSEKSDL